MTNGCVCGVCGCVHDDKSVPGERSYCLPSKTLRTLNDSKAAMNVSTVLFPSSTHRVMLALMLPSPRAIPRYTCTHSGSLVPPWVVREAWRTLSYSLFTLSGTETGRRGRSDSINRKAERGVSLFQGFIHAFIEIQKTQTKGSMCAVALLV